MTAGAEGGKNGWRKRLSSTEWIPITMAVRLRVFPGTREINRPCSLKLSTPRWLPQGWNSLIAFALNFIRLLTNKHMGTIHSWALIAFSFKVMAGLVSSVKNYLNPSLTSNLPSHFPKIFSHAFQKVSIAAFLHDFAQIVDLSLLSVLGLLEATEQATSILLLLFMLYH